MKKQNIVSAIALSLVLAAGVAGSAMVLVSPHRAEAADQTVSPAVGRPLTAARDLATEKKFKEAIVKAKEADAVAKKSDYESYMTSEILGSIYLQARQYANAAATLEKSIATGQLSPEETTARVKLLSQVFYQVKNYRKAIQYGQKSLQGAANDIATMVIVGQSQYLLKQYKPASATMRNVVRTAKRSRAKINETWLQLLMTAEYELGNDAGVRGALEELIRYYPSDRYWTDYVAHVEKDLKGAKTKTALDLLRFRLSSGAMQNAKDYTDMAELALQEGLPGDAQRVLETGQAAGIIGAGPQAGRHKRLMAMAVERATEDKAQITTGATEAAALVTGDADISFGEAYWTYGQYSESVEAIQRGIGKGVENADEAQLRLGLAFLGAGDKAKATAAFKKITAGSPEAKIAALWTLKGSI
jgi:tetratricopeptide (TPR) repeat protein